jgi:glycosyltransferase involved in cell wall biosynthesis
MYGTPGEDFDSSLLDKLPSNVSYKGPFTDFYKLPLGSYSAFLYTSLFDGIPNALVEATSAKLPIVASASGGIGEFITQDTGVLVDDIYNAKSYADGVIQILNNTKLANSYVDAATHMLEKDYSPSRFSEAIRNLIETIND